MVTAIRSRWRALALVLAFAMPGATPAQQPVPRVPPRAPLTEPAGPPAAVPLSTPPTELAGPPSPVPQLPTMSLAAAARACELAPLRSRLASGADPNEAEDGVAPLMLAVSGCCSRHPDDDSVPAAVVYALIERGAAIDHRGASGRTALIEAAGVCGARVSEVLLANGADPHALDAQGITALLRAVLRNHAGVAATIAARGAWLSGRHLLIARQAARNESMRALVERHAR